MRAPRPSRRWRGRSCSCSNYGRVVSTDLFPRVSVARRIDRELFVLLVGTPALLLQVAHPLVAAGVAQHSDFRRDPVGR
ncbi:MAG TPA: oxygenase MpaB family protein, partial [Candidatus Limnocylindria bacterium]|nr:oxygenase MpaB family protein [Candidatus Limnocylindria bacterium]